MRLLVVEDEVGIANFLKQGLEEESFTVDVCHTGNQGLELALSGEYDLLLLDWMLPGKSGIEICTEFRKQFKTTPIIFLTAKDTLQEIIFSLQNGANDYIKKPFHFEELLERVRVQLRPKSGETNLLTLGPITIDLSAHTVFKNKAEITLTQKEFALLEMLIRNKGIVCTRTRIIESVWDIHFDYNTGIIDVYINALRKKLHLGEDENYIQTIRGVGYIAKEV
ncbi:response regulator transcription factor [Fluviicola sp.]|jgi:DNA-binding response OmpR family regulator|uniref:response regulator transcription factor n=1 Tax=Fluviicola sp. TaxID=1917219 RepID=UPI00283536FA|nr:response regulator transcription factor [Fluviicola sp.]MDR0801543.1 response regulator transcription factor [Fluviicola sp.]